MNTSKKPTQKELWQSILEQIGLSSKESQIYLTLLEHGEMSPAMLAKKSNLKRGIVYELIGRLSEQNLITTLEHASGKTVQAQSPENLIEMARDIESTAQKTKQQLETIVEDLKKQQTEGPIKPTVSYDLGRDSLEKPLRSILKSKNKEIYYIRASQHNPKLMDEFDSFISARKKENIKTYMVSQESAKQYVDIKSDKKNLIDRKFIENDAYNSPIDINIFDDKTIFANQNKSVSITIEDADIANAMKQIIIALRKRL